MPQRDHDPPPQILVPFTLTIIEDAYILDRLLTRTFKPKRGGYYQAEPIQLLDVIIPPPGAINGPRRRNYRHIIRTHPQTASAAAHLLAELEGGQRMRRYIKTPPALQITCACCRVYTCTCAFTLLLEHIT